MSQRLIDCPICRSAHPAGIRCDEWRDQQRKEKEAAARKEPEPMNYSGSNPMIALAVAEGWGGSAKFNDADLRAALHQTTGIAFMREYVAQAAREGVLTLEETSGKDRSTRTLMRLFKKAYDRYGLTRTREDAPVPVNAGPRENVVYLGRGEGEPFKMGNTTYKPEDEPQAAAPQDGTKVQGYRSLSDVETNQMNNFKKLSRAFVSEIDRVIRETKDRMSGPAMQSTEQREADGAALRWLAIARTQVQQGTMAACRAVAKPSDDS